MLPDRVPNPGPLTYESGALPIALRGPAIQYANYRCNSEDSDQPARPLSRIRSVLCSGRSRAA